MTKTIEIRSQEQLEQLVRSSKVVLADFWADWCGPCKVIAPVFEKLADKWAKPNLISFAKVDNDKNQALATKYQVSALPTIIMFENGKETQRFKGSDTGSLLKMTERFSTITSQGSQGSWTSDLPRGYTDVTGEIDALGMELLNADTELGSARTLFNDEKPSGAGSPSDKGKGKATGSGSSTVDWVESDTDSQLMLYVPFQSTIKIHSIHITSFASREEDEEDDEVPARPRSIKLYINKSHNLGFDEADDMLATQEVELKPSDWRTDTKTAVVETRFVKFQNVSSLVLFVVDAEGEAEKTRIDRIRIIGETGEKRSMGKLQKMGDDES